MLACRPAVSPEVQWTASGLRVTAVDGVSRVTVIDPGGVPELTRAAPEPVPALELRVARDRVGTWRVQVDTTRGRFEIPLLMEELPAPMVVEVESPVGQGARVATDGEEVAVPLFDGHAAQVAVSVTALRDGPARVSLGGVTELRPTLRAGERLVAIASLSEPTTAEVEAGGAAMRVALSTRAETTEALRERLSVTGVAFPAEAGGAPDLTRPAGRVTLPSPWWRAVLARTGLGFRPRDSFSPWAWAAVTLENAGTAPINLVVRARVLDPDGAPDPAFRPRMREADDGSGEVRVLLRVPAGAVATAAVPVYVDDAALELDPDRVRSLAIDVLPLGLDEPLLRWAQPLYTTQGSAAASVGLLVALLAAAGGATLLALRGRRWLTEAATSDLMTIALFGALIFLVGTAGQLATMGLAALLGPFAFIVTGLVDDAFRYALLATLITLLPRPGTGALAVLVGWLLSGIALGSLGPFDALFVGGRVFWLEGALWVTGITRSGRWRDQAAWLRWARLATAFSVASCLGTATGLVLHVVLYRLFYAWWYVAIVLALPGALYVAVAVGFAVPFADSLRRIQR